MNYANGDKYTGNWVDDARTGEGVYIFANRNRYQSRYSQITRQPVVNH